MILECHLLARDAQAQQLIIDRQDRENLHDECKKHVCCDFRTSQCVDQRITILTPVIILVARHDAIKFDEDGLPVPEPAITN